MQLQINRDRRTYLGLIAAVSTVALMLTACGSGEPTDSSGDADTSAPLYSSLPDAIKKQGFITLGVDPSYPPFDFYGADGTTIEGMDPELMAAVSEKIGVPIQISQVSFDAVIPSLTGGRYDMSIAMTDTLERQKQVSFVDYLEGGNTIVLPKGNPHNVTVLDDLCGLKAAIAKGTTQIEDAKTVNAACEAANKPLMESLVLPGQSDIVLALSTGRADVALMDAITGQTLASTTSEGFTFTKNYKSSQFGIVFPKESTELIDVFQKAMTQIAADGTYLSVLTKYNIGASALASFTINGATK
jgi:polar amino acid transport system substrate-binding protein